MKLRIPTLAVFVLALLAAASLALALALTEEAEAPANRSALDEHGRGHHRHGGLDGHLPATSQNVKLVGKARVKKDAAGRIADVGVFGNHAYLGAFNEPDCRKGGVYILDISKPSAPVQVGFIATGNNSYVGEGVQVIHVDTPVFTGDVLALNNEICGRATRATDGGISLYDVTNPRRPVKLAVGVGDRTPPSWFGQGLAHQVHSVFMWDAGDRAYAVAQDNEEGPDVDILDITNPRQPQVVAEHDLEAMFPQIQQIQLPIEEVYHHDVIVKQQGDRFVMLVSYWDGGYVKLDVTDPLNPIYLADSDFAGANEHLLERTGLSRVPEGNAHEAEFSKDNNFIVAADEDFEPFTLLAENLTDGQQFSARPAFGDMFMPQGGVIQGETVFVGRACAGMSPPVPAGNGAQIAVLERGSCQLVAKLSAVEQAGGYKAIVVFNNTTPFFGTSCNRILSLSVQIDATGRSLPAFGITPRRDGYDLFGIQDQYDDAACLNAELDEPAPIEVGAVGKVVKLKKSFDGWGYARLFDNNDGKLQQLDTFAIVEGHDPGKAAGYGDLTIHEVAMSQRADDLAYFSYYAGGLRVARIVNDQLVEVGRFIDQGGNNLWGVQVWEKAGKEYVLASDRDYGLYIFEYTGPGKVNP